MDQTMAVLDHYGALRLVYRVRGDRPVDAIRNELLTVLQQKQPTLAAT
jgi:hypothetical protein